MPDAFIQLPADSTGKKMRTFDPGDAAGVSQYVSEWGKQTYTITSGAVVPAASKHHISLFNGASSVKTIKIRKVFPIDLALAAVTGVALQFDFWHQTTAQSAGTALTAIKHDSNNAALDANLLLATGATVTTPGTMLFPFTWTNDEVGATQAFPSSLMAQATNWLPEGNEIQELTLNAGEGFSIQQITSSTIGSLGWIVVFTQE